MTMEHQDGISEPYEICLRTEHSLQTMGAQYTRTHAQPAHHQRYIDSSRVAVCH